MQAVDRNEGLWAACASLQEDPALLRGLFGQAGPDPEPIVLAYGPVARRNQFQALLYSRSRELGFHLMPVQKLALFGRIPWAGKVVCHFHWVHELTHRAADREAADLAVAQWRELVARIKVNGHRVVWTVHNVLPHESMWPDHDRQVHQLMADAADLIHVMSEGTTQVCAPHYRLDPGKLLQVPHPSYLNAQADWISRTQARAELAVAAEDFVFLTFGAVLAYKGYDALMPAFARLAARAGRPLRLVVAGAPGDAGTVNRLRAWAFARSDVLLDLRIIPSDDLQVFFRAADLAVCPYERTLNSGAALMATAFGVPVVGPRVGGFVDSYGSGGGFLYDPADAAGLEGAMEEALNSDLAPHVRASQVLNQRFAPAKVSSQFLTGLRERLWPVADDSPHRAAAG